MKRVAPWLMLVGGILLVLSGFAHGCLGGPEIRKELQKLNATPDVIETMSIGWHYGSAAMVAFGLIVISAWWNGRTGKLAVAIAVGLIGLLYIGFGVWALIYSSYNSHFLAFIALGAILGVAAIGTTSAANNN